MAEPRYTCGTCGTWTCDACGGKRPTTGVEYCSYPCHRCRKREGVLSPTMHTERMWRRHNQGPLPSPYPYGEQSPAEEWGRGFGPRIVPSPTYLGVPYPEIPCDMDAWMRGVHDAMHSMGEDRR